MFIVDLLSLIVSKKEIDMSLLTVLVMVGYSSLFESRISTYFIIAVIAYLSKIFSFSPRDAVRMSERVVYCTQTAEDIVNFFLVQ